MISLHETVSSLLVAAGMELSPEETDRLALSYPKLRKAVDLLYDVAVHDEEPILVFRHDISLSNVPDNVRAPENTTTK